MVRGARQDDCMRPNFVRDESDASERWE